MQIYDLNELVRAVRRKLEKSPHCKLKTLFRFFREQKYFSPFGDYPVLSAIYIAAYETGIRYSRTDITAALRLSEEFNGKWGVSKLLEKSCGEITPECPRSHREEDRGD